MKHFAILLAIISIATGTLSAQSYKGVLCDTSGNVINELAAIIVLNKRTLRKYAPNILKTAYLAYRRT